MDKPINVYWVSYHDDVLAHGYWDDALLDDTFKRGNFKHHVIKNTPFPDIEENAGGIFIINGRTHVDDIDKINTDIAKLRWVLVIVTGDEEASLPWQDIKHPIMKIWMMLPRMSKHNDTHFKLPNGYRPTTHEDLKNVGIKERIHDYVFIGQNNHERRNQCVDVAKQFQPLYPSSLIKTTDGFGKEDTPYRDYLDIFAKSKIVLCPSGVESPDSFRVYEALEAGCIPVVDAFSTNFKTPGFWKYLFGETPFPEVTYWDELPLLLPTLLKEYPANVNQIFSWWQRYKRNLYWQIIDDVEELSK